MVLRFGAGTNINAAFALSGVRSLTVDGLSVDGLSVDGLADYDVVI